MRLARGSQSGHTLVELLVVTTLMGLITAFLAQAWRPIGKSTAELRDTAIGLTEMRLALDFLRQDLGAAETIGRADAIGADLQIMREPAALARLGRGVPQSDSGVLYSLREGKLLREDLFTGERFAVARDFLRFEVNPLGNGSASLVLAVQDGPDERELELIWSR